MGSNINETLGVWSEWFMLLAAFTYLVAFVAFVWDMASHSKAIGEAERAAQRQSAVGREDSKELVGATSRGGSVSVSAASSGRTVGHDGARNGSVAGEFRTTADARTKGADEFEALNYKDSVSRPAARAAVVVMGIAFLLHAFAVVARGIAADRVPWANMYEFCSTGALVVAGVYLVTLIFKDLRFVGPMVSGLVLLMLCAATIAFPTPVSPLPPALQSYWLIIHVSIAVAASGLFTITFAMAVLQLLQSRREKNVTTGEDTKLGFLRVVPNSTTLENFAFRLNSVGFVFWTFTLAAGAIWADQAWGRFWGWDTKEVWTFVIWTVYAAYMHARVTRGWNGNRSAWLSIAGYICVVFNFTVVNVYFPGLHSYSGL
ncbi:MULTISPECIES: c-type cytochrome biogenesis protein CcsB [Kocuria]|jgi:cytochrome c-type biogenesis protein CcsB|uniref:C-type cytochrome biogenesis protein CcsB n=1 Tax=Kocuria gwangalliensis TaxID=501592 RepID=A0ABP8WFD8_9MICC|nr:c-type cytochrome biogenesis protein CcsB [Kocuria sp.]MDO5367988.1 c-type cytochrome biogenesis protein CcsB [Kocuria sp.]